MAQLDVDFAGVGEAIGRSAVAVRIDLSSKWPPRPAVLAKLQTWLDQAAPAVAAPIPFRSSEYRGNGSNPAGGCSSAAA
jgi:hypothetical protein